MKSILTIKPASIALAAAFGLVSSLTLAATINPEGVMVEPQQQNGIVFLNGGIGLDEANAIRAAKGYNLKMTFATGPKNSFLADVGVDVRTRSGEPVLSLSNAGPLVYAALPSGEYDVTVSSGGQAHRKTVAIQSGRTIMVRPSGEFAAAASPVQRVVAGPARAANFHWSYSVD